ACKVWPLWIRVKLAALQSLSLTRESVKLTQYRPSSGQRHCRNHAPLNSRAKLQMLRPPFYELLALQLTDGKRCEKPVALDCLTLLFRPLQPLQHVVVPRVPDADSTLQSETECNR